ncbi:uncharacterized protein LOC127869397 [Dreissena polymorpha]|uniref:Mab-21-like HhH/H2TH-like domain-containing protein n=1 Tax=Dreissena polymorpha TaxID=45954 RepID=A0A9D4RNU9_DREPO|nr:uncharacterized protein LOC127869397 [Dreissena polymorpha]XP_052267905.1 uncharacterized protein LOC127869397 [Dreissena polymorpha]KAH3875369.1 hypothetical protein DPMN_038632 [Dreissena polymorpha]
MAECGSSHDMSSRFQRQNSVDSNRYQNENFSVEVNTILNCLGYGPDIRRFRRESYRFRDKVLNRRESKDKVMCVTVGSKLEGLTSFFESDTDCIILHSRVVCLETGVDPNAIANNISIFKMDTRSCYAGHCKQLLVRIAPGHHPAFSNSIVVDPSGNRIFSNLKLVTEFQKAPMPPSAVSYPRAGPSIPVSVGAYHQDTVHAIPCYCPSILERWAKRQPRHWPPTEIVQKVVSQGAFLVPTGFKGSEHKDEEFRICFNTGENELVSNLNDTQVKIYVLLKMVVKEVLKPQKKEVSSYVVKDIVLWQAESNPQYLFHERSLLHWLHEGLSELRAVVSSRQLQYYMIPERNLMAHCGLDDEQQQTWVKTITEMMNEGPKLLLRFMKIRKAIISYKQPLQWYSKMRTELELLQLKDMIRRELCTDKNLGLDLTDRNMKKIEERQQDILWEIALRMYMDGNGVQDWWDLNERMLS